MDSHLISIVHPTGIDVTHTLPVPYTASSSPRSAQTHTSNDNQSAIPSAEWSARRDRHVESLSHALSEAEAEAVATQRKVRKQSKKKKKSDRVYL
jgi:hypothetical protein